MMKGQYSIPTYINIRKYVVNRQFKCIIKFYKQSVIIIPLPLNLIAIIADMTLGEY